MRFGLGFACGALACFLAVSLSPVREDTVPLLSADDWNALVLEVGG